tara:strand:- start:100 stop:1032 length:933 start_codon:yes stop_codon:yes gene_type:complete
MKKILLMSSIIFFFFINKTSYSQKVYILYTIDNNPITNVEINNEITYLKLFNKNLRSMDKEPLVVYATKSIIREKIKEVEVKKYFKLGLNEEIVNQRIYDLVARANIKNIEEFYQLLNNLNLEKDFIKKKLEIEILWNKLIFEKYKDKLSINEDKIQKDLRYKIENQTEVVEEFKLYEILFTGSTTNIDTEFEKIIKSIEEIGFENTARIFSTSNSSSAGGEVGWVKKTQLSDKIYQEIKNLKDNEISNVINAPSGKLILMIKERKDSNKKLSFNEEYKKILNFEKNKQLNQFSTIYFKKVELNTVINEK